MDLNRKREAEISKLRRDVDEANAQHEQAISSMRSKNQQALAEVQEELETFKKSKAK
jgi:outer membrane protein TolC